MTPATLPLFGNSAADTTTTDPARNLLPYDGIVNDHGAVFAAEADVLLAWLLEHVPWQHDQIRLYGKTIVTARQIAWYGDEAFNYRYSGVDHRAQAWADPLRALRDRVVQRLGVPFNACLLNRYEDGTQGMAWHSDDERELGPGNTIASVSFGATRKFVFRHRRTREKVEMWLGHGQLIVMRGETQTHWQHALMKSARVTAPRVNLTFRLIRNG